MNTYSLLTCIIFVTVIIIQIDDI